MQDRERIAGWDVHEWRDPVAEYKRRLWPGGKMLLEEVSYVAGDDGDLDAAGGSGGRLLWCLVDLTTISW